MNGTKAYLSLDLSAAYGGGAVVPWISLPRHNKAVLEHRVASVLLDCLRSQTAASYTVPRSNPKDPPDLEFEVDGNAVGLELVELVPENRFAKDHQLRLLRDRVLDRLPIGPLTKNWVFSIFFRDDYAAKFSIRGLEHALAEGFDAFLRSVSASEEQHVLEVPEELRTTVLSLFAARSTLAPNDVRLRNPDAPLIVFGAQTTRIVPSEDFPNLVLNTLGPKFVQDVPEKTWLLIWTAHHALITGTDELYRYIVAYLTLLTPGYQRVFYLEHGPTGRLWEIPAEALETLRNRRCTSIDGISGPDILELLKTLGDPNLG